MSKFNVTTLPGYNIAGRGQHSVELVMSLTGSKGVFVWRLALGIGPIGPYPSHNPDYNIMYGVNINPPCDMGLSAHSELSIENASEEDYRIHDSCEYLEGRACCCDYSQALTGLMPVFACEGFSGVERVLRERYAEHYGEEA
jgi:hypothetical protein